MPFHCSAMLTLPLDPAASHILVETQETPSRTLKALGLGVGWMTHIAPFHDSANVLVAPLTCAEPTAVQEVADTQETLVNELYVAPLGVGVGSIDQAVPFHCSARVISPEQNPPLHPVSAEPTPVHAVGDVHDMPLRTLALDPLGFGVGWIDQALPSHTSARVFVVQKGLQFTSEEPVAIHDVAAVHDTALNRLALAPFGLSDGPIVHAVPSQRSASGTGIPVWLSERPTAMHAVLETHETAASALGAAPLVLGIDWIDHALPSHPSTRLRCGPTV